MSEETNCIRWESDLPVWKAYNGKEPCHLCGNPDTSIYKKSHSRSNGVILEASLMYCRGCNTDRKEEVQQDFDKWWKEQWAAAEAKCEANWQKYGIYGNCWDGTKNQPSAYFGYVKNDDGTFTPHRYLHPETDFDRFDGAIYFESKRIASMSLSNKESCMLLREFVTNFEPQNTKIDHYRGNKIKDIDEFEEIADEDER